MRIGGTLSREDPRNEGVYVPLEQNTLAFMSLFVRTERDPETYTAAIQRAVNRVDPVLPLYFVRPLDETYYLDSWFCRAFGTLFLTFGFAALVLAVVGLYGVMAFSVGQRTREIGVRMALGARRRDILSLIVHQGGRQLAIGLVIGIAFALLLSRMVSTMLYGVRPFDPTVFATVVLVLATTGLAASAIPAARAAYVNVTEALRRE